MVVYGLRMMHVLKSIHAVKLFCGGSFWVIWLSIVLAFAQQMTHGGTVLWGGAFGQWMAQWMHSYVQTMGMVLILVVVLVIFLIVTDPKFIDRCKTFGNWCISLFQRKPKTEVAEELSLPEDPTDEQTIELPIDINDTKQIETKEEEDVIPISIDEPLTEETTEKDQDEDLKPTPIVKITNLTMMKC